MPEVKDVSFGYGSVRHVREVEETPTTTHVNGNVTVNNMGRPGVAGHFEVTFMISCDVEDEGHEVRNVFHWTSIVPEPSKTAPYLEVESAAARQLAPLFRQVAQALEDQVKDFDAKNASQEDQASVSDS